MKQTATLALALALLVTSAGPSPAGAVDLSPESWPAGELEEYTELNQLGRREKPQAEGSDGMVVGTTGALAVRAGLEALHQGGSAIDAALVTALTQVTLAAGSWVSYAGVLSLMHYDASGRRVRSLNAEFNTPLGEDDPLSIPGSGPSGRTALVPGFMDGVEEAHRRWGKLPFAALFEPAIYFAEEGFPIDAELAATIEFRSNVLARRPETRAIFFRPDGSLYRRGDVLRQPELAATLRRVARDGADYMYRGPWAERLVAALAAEGGKLALADLERYSVLVKKPKRVRYREWKVLGPAPPGAGGRLAARALRSLKKVDLAAHGHYSESADSLYELMRATRAVYGSVPPLNHSDAVIAADAEGNVASLLHSINTTAWGETGLFVDGVSIPDAAAHQQRRVLQAGPGNRIWSGTNPLMVLRRKSFAAASSAIGRGLFEATIQSLVNLLDFGMEPGGAVDAVQFRSPRRPPPDGRIAQQLVTRRQFPADLLDAVRDRGIPILELSPIDPEGRGYWIGVARRPDDGRLLGATTDFFNGLAEGY